MLKYVIKNICDISEDDLKQSFLYMTDSRKAKVERQKNIQAKKCTLAGEWLVRVLLSEITGKDKESFVIKADKSGKLFSKNCDGLLFNISHSENIVTAAVSDKDLGIDIELLRPVNLKLAKKMCNESEILYIFGHKPEDDDYEKNSDPDYIRRFLEIWTLKEAYLKYKGTGITGFDSFNLPTSGYKKMKIENTDYVMHIVTKADCTIAKGNVKLILHSLFD